MLKSVASRIWQPPPMAKVSTAEIQSFSIESPATSSGGTSGRARPRNILFTKPRSRIRNHRNGILP
jgi:hypothetical protein